MMKVEINDQTYKLDKVHFIKKRYQKQQIVFGNSFSENMNHFNGWESRLGGKFRRTAPFSIDIKGNIFQHYNPEFYSEFFGVKGLDEHIIPIIIENEGWLTKDIPNDVYINYVGNIYNRNDEIVEKRWKDQTHWAPYTKQQLKSAIKLTKYLCEVFNIPLEVPNHNTKFDGVYDFNGVVYRSNFDKVHSDLSPAWDYITFKNKIEEN